MALLDRIREAATVHPDTDLLEFFGVGPGGLRWDGGRVTVGDESVSVAEARAALAGGPVAQTPARRRTVAIGDL